MEVKYVVRSISLLGTAMFLFCISCSTSKDLPSKTKWNQLFENSTNWKTEGAAVWKLENGVIGIQSDSGNGFLISQESYDNFRLKLEFKPDVEVNSGIFIRCSDSNVSAVTCDELNIWDEHPNQDFRTGAIVTKKSPIAKVNTLDRWNSFEVLAQGKEITMWINDIKVNHYTDSNVHSGPIILQHFESGSIYFRNVQIQEL